MVFAGKLLYSKTGGEKTVGKSDDLHVAFCMLQPAIGSSTAIFPRKFREFFFSIFRATSCHTILYPNVHIARLTASIVVR
jgi:hypothetical protein